MTEGHHLYDDASAILDREYVGYSATAHYMPTIEAPTSCTVVLQVRLNGYIIDSIDCAPERAVEVIDHPALHSRRLCEWLNQKPSIEGLRVTCF